MGQAVGLGADRDLLGALAAGDPEAVLERCGERLLTTVWGCDAAPTLVPRAGLVAWFRGRDALTDDGVRIRPLATVDVAGPTVALLLHSLDRTGIHHSYETVDRWVFQAGRLVAWFSRPADPAQYARAWGLRHPDAANPAGRAVERRHVVEVSQPSNRPTVTGAKGTTTAAGDDPGAVQDEM